MKNSKTVSPAPKDKPKTAPLTLADIEVTWTDGRIECTASGEDLMIALVYMAKQLNFEGNGRGTFSTFTCPDEAESLLKGAEILASCAGSASEDREVTWEASKVIEETIMGARIRWALHKWKKSPEDYCVNIRRPAAAVGGAR